MTDTMNPTFKLNLGTVPLLRDMTRLGSPGGPPAFAESTGMLERGPRVSPPVDLADRAGYNQDFLPGLTVPVPKPIGDQNCGSSDIGRRGWPLTLHPFFARDSRSRKLAMFTAVNMDGSRS